MAWTAGGDLLAVKRSHAGAGVYDAAFEGGGYNTAFLDTIEKYDGLVWSAGGYISATRQLMGAAGYVTAGLFFGGQDSTPTQVATTEEYDGTSCSAGGNLSSARYYHAGFGLQTAAVAAGGTGASAYDTTEEYDAAAWSAGGTLPTVKSSVGGAFGLLTAGVLFGGTVSGGPGGTAVNTTAGYDGAAWTNGATLSTARTVGAGSGNQTNGLAIAGASYSGSWTNYSSVEKYDGSAWSAFDSINTACRLLSAAGSGSYASICFGGLTTAAVATTERSVATAAFTSAGSSTVSMAAAKHKQGSMTVAGVSTVSMAPIGGTVVITASMTVAGVSTVSMAPIVSPTASMTIAAVSTVTMAPTALLPLHPYTVLGFPAGHEAEVEYQVLDIAKAVVLDWTNIDVVETATGVTGYSVYDVITRLERGFQGLILWRLPGTTYHAQEPIDLTPFAYPTLMEMKLGGIALETTAQSRLAAADYTAPDNAGIAANGAAITRLLGLALENHVEDDIIRDGPGNKTSSVIYCYNSAANASAHVSGGGGGTGLIAKYQTAFTYSPGGRMTLNKVIRVV